MISLSGHQISGLILFETGIRPGEKKELMNSKRKDFVGNVHAPAKKEVDDLIDTLLELND